MRTEQGQPAVSRVQGETTGMPMHNSAPQTAATQIAGALASQEAMMPGAASTAEEKHHVAVAEVVAPVCGEEEPRVGCAYAEVVVGEAAEAFAEAAAEAFVVAMADVVDVAIAGVVGAIGAAVAEPVHGQEWGSWQGEAGSATREPLPLSLED